MSVKTESEKHGLIDLNGTRKLKNYLNKFKLVSSTCNQNSGKTKFKTSYIIQMCSKYFKYLYAKINRLVLKNVLL